MGFLFKKKQKEQTVAIFDVGSGSVGGAIVQIPINKEELPSIISLVRTPINYNSDKINVNVFTKSMLKALGQTVESLYKTKSGAPDKIICVLASPWYSSETRVVKIKKESPFVFTQKLANDLIKKEIETIASDHNKKNKTLYNEIEIIEHYIMSVSLNGYDIDLPIGMHTEAIEMNIVASFSQKVFLDKICQVVSKTFHDIPVSFSSFIIASYFAIRDKYISPNSYLLLDIGGEVTEVGIVSKGVLKASLSFPFGRKTYFKYMCTKLEIELRDAQELFNLYNSGQLSEEKRKEVEPLFKSIENSWSESFRNSVGNLPHVLALPSTVFLTADHDMLPYFSKVVENEEFIQSMTLEHKCTVVSLKGPEFLKICKIGKGVNCDPFLMIEAIAMVRGKIK